MFRTFRRSRAMLAAALLATSLAACNSTTKVTASSDTTGAAAAADKPGHWTIYVYMAADNNLEPFAVDDFAQMSKATGTDLVVLVDRSKEYSRDPMGPLGDFTDARLVHIRDGKVEQLASPGELNMGDPATLSSFLGNGLKKYRSDHNGLVIWDHGGAWSGAAVDEGSGGDKLELEEIRTGVADGLKSGGVGQLDLVGFDACLMASYETAAILRPYTRYLLASEEVEPGHGWDWSSVSTPAAGATTKDLGQSIIDGYVRESAAAAQDPSSEGEEAITLSLLDLQRLDAVDKALTKLSGQLDANAAGLVGRVGTGRANALSFGRSPDPAQDFNMVDLGDLAHQLSGINGLRDAAQQLQAAVKGLVVHEVSSSPTAAATGVSVYFPPTAALGEPSYEKLTVAAPWVGFLRAYYTGSEGLSPDQLPAFLDKDKYLEDKEVDFSNAGIGLHANVTPGTGVNLTEARLYWGEVDVRDAQTVAFYGERNATIKGDTVSASYDWRMLTISDGRVTAPAYATLDVDDKGNITRIVVPGRLKLSGRDLDAVLVLTIHNGSVTSERFYGMSGQTASEVEPGPADTFTPRLLVQSMKDFSSKWVDAPAGALTAEPSHLIYKYQRLAPATAVFVELGITDVAGGHDYVFHGTASP